MAKVFTCPQCQAPLKWKGRAAVVECCYCHSHVITGQKEPDDSPSTPRDPAGTITQLPAQVVAIRGYKPRGAGLTLFIVLFSMALPAAIIFFVFNTINKTFDTVTTTIEHHSRNAPPTIPRQQQTPPGPGAPTGFNPEAIPVLDLDKRRALLTPTGKPAKASKTAQKTPPPPTGPSVGTAQLFALSPAQKGGSFARSLSATYRKKAVSIALSDDRFERAVVTWDRRGRHAKGLKLILTRKDDTFGAALQGIFGPRLAVRPGGGRELALGGTSVRLSADGKTFEAYVLPATDAEWRARFVALWAMARAAALGERPTLTPQTSELIFKGYGVRDMIAFELSTFASGALDSKARPPGMVKLDGQRFLVPLDNPWFKDAQLLYERKDGRLSRVEVKAWASVFPADVVAKQMACLNAAFGVPQVDVDKGLSRYRWSPKGLRRVTWTAARFSVEVEAPGTAPTTATQAAWTKLWKATAACSGESLQQ